MSSKGFTTRAARDLIDAIAETTEPVEVYCVHDADAAGTLIQHTVQHATLARGARKIEIIDLGLQPWEGVALGLAIERVPVQFNRDGTQRRRPVGEYVRARSDRAPGGETWERWLQHSRVELNAFTSAELIAWLDGKMAEHGAGKVIPPDDVLHDRFRDQVRPRVHAAVVTAIDRRLNEKIDGIEAEQNKATKEIRAEIDRITAAPRARLALVSRPFLQRIEKAKAEALAIDREAEVHRAIGRITPSGDKLQKAIGKAFTKRPMLHWSAVLHEIADGARVVEIDGDQGGAA